MKGANPARIAAARALVAVEQGRFVQEVLSEDPPAKKEDRALAWHLALGVLRRRAELDAALRVHLSRPLTGMDAEVRAVLRMGAFEKLFSRTKTYAVVDQGVRVAKALRLGRASGLVNAVLRRVEAPKELTRCERLNHPAWLIARWDARYGREATEAWCSKNQDEPPLTVVGRGEGTFALPTQEVTLFGRPLAKVGVVETRGGPVDELPGFADGGFWVQDAAAVAMADLVRAGPKMDVLDACAAPGGKAFRLVDQGATVKAIDRCKDRLARLTASARRLGMEIPTEVHDWEAGPLESLGTFDAVLLDAPCSGLGTVRRHPEIRWRRQENDLEEMAQRQLTILRHVAPAVRRGGALVYTVCSSEPEEGGAVVQAFLAQNDDFSEVERRCTAPPEGDEDAHFGVRLERQ